MAEYTSLCYISERDGRKVLCRIADYGDGFYYPNTYDYKAIPPALIDESNRDLIFGNPRSFVHDVEDIGLYSWHSEWNSIRNRWDTKIDDAPTTIPWIEVFKTGLHSLREVVTAIRNGYQIHSRFDKAHDCVFSIDATGENAIYVAARQLKERDGKLFFKDDVQSVLKGNIISRDVLSCECRYSAYSVETERFYYRRTAKWDPKNTIGIKDTPELVGDIVKSKLKNALSRTDRQAAVRALNIVNTGSVAEELSSVLECSVTDAKRYVDEYFASRKARLEENESINLIESLMAADSSLVDRLRAQLDAQYKADHAQLLKKFADEIAEQQHKLDNTIATVQKEDGHLKQLIMQQTEAEEAANKAVELQRDVDTEIKRRLSEIRENQAHALVDTAFARIYSAPASPSIEPHESAASHAATLPTIVRPKDEDTEDLRYDDAYQDAVDFFRQFCIDQASASELVLFAFASFVCNQPLIIAGEQGVSLANLFASYCTGAPCTTVVMKDSDSSEDIIQALSQDIPEYVCIIDAFDHGYEEARKVMDFFPGTRFILTARHPESLFMEPKSVFNTFLPILTEFYLVNAIPEIPTGYSCKDSLRTIRVDPTDINRARTFQNDWFGGVYASPQLRMRCAKLQATLDFIAKAVTSNEDVAKNSLGMVAVAPLLHYLGNTDGINLLLNRLPQLDPDRIQMVKLYAGL